jgi:hypothetical protein
VRLPGPSQIPALACAAAAILLPTSVLGFLAHDQVSFGAWTHFIGVGLTAPAATVAAVALTIAGARRPGPLTDDEFAVVKRHPEWGRKLLGELGGFADSVRRLVLDHHERLAGDGYPRGLREDDLHLDTRILTVCDVYDALISPRVYRDAWTHERAIALLREETEAAFDQRCVSALERVLSRERNAGLAVAV